MTSEGKIFTDFLQSMLVYRRVKNHKKKNSTELNIFVVISCTYRNRDKKKDNSLLLACIPEICVYKFRERVLDE